MASDYDRALALQNKVLGVSTKLADEIRVRPARRNAVAIAALWREMCAYRPKLAAQHRALRKQERRPRGQLDRDAYESQRRVVQETKLLGQRLQKWTWMDSLITRHMNPSAEEISLNFVENPSDEMLELFHFSFFQLANPYGQSDDAKGLGCFADIPMNIQPFRCLMTAAYRLLLIQGRADTARFLDVGCGGGTKVLAASLYFPECHGLDYDDDYVKAGQRMIEVTNSERCQIFQADGLTFQGYENYDVIYFYRPLRDDAMLAKMEDQIFENARPGTVILAPYTGFLEPRKGNDRPNIKECIFIAGMDQDEIDALHQDAVYTSTEKMLRPKGLRFDTGFWTPILNAATFNGQS